MCDEFDEKSACEIGIIALFGFFTQQIVSFIQRPYRKDRQCTAVKRSGRIRKETVTRSIEVNR